MKRNYKNVLIYSIAGFSAFFLVLYLSVLVVFPINFNANNFKSEIESEFFNNTGLILKLEDISLKPSLSPFLRINAHHVLVLYPENKEMLKIRNMSLKISVLPLLTKKIKIDSILANRPILSMDIASDGRCSLDKYITLQKRNVQKSSDFSIVPEIPEIIFDNYRIKIYDKLYKEPFIIDGEKLKIFKNQGNNRVRLITTSTLSQNNVKYIYGDTDVEIPLIQTETRLFQTNPFRHIKNFSVKSNIKSRIKIFDKNGNKEVSGNMNIDNLSLRVNNQNLDNNFVKLKFDKNKIDINAYLKAGKDNYFQVSGFYESGKNQKINLSVISEQINLELFSKTAKTILNAFDIPCEVLNYNFFGIANLNFKIRSNFKTIRSEGFAELKNVSISGNGLPCKINKIQSKINFDNNTINILNSEMFINGMPASISGTVNANTDMNIKISAKNLNAENLSHLLLTKEQKEKYGVKGFLDINAEIKGKIKTPKIELLAEIRDAYLDIKNVLNVFLKRGKISFSGTNLAPKGTLNLSDIKLKNYSGGKYLGDIKLNDLNISFDKDVLKIDKTDILFENEKLTANAEIKNYKTTPLYNGEINGNLKSSTIYEYLRQNPSFAKYKAAAKGYIPIQIKISGKGKSGKLSGEFKANKDNYISYIVIRELLGEPSVLEFDVNFNEEEISINEVNLSKTCLKSKENVIIKIAGKIKSFKSPSLEKIKVSIPNLLSFSSAGLKNSEISVKADIIADGKISEPNLRGNLLFKNINIPEYHLLASNSEIIFEGKDTRFSLPRLNIGSSKIAIKGDLNIIADNKFRVNNLVLNSDILDLDELNEYLSETSTDNVYPGISLPINADKGIANIKLFKTGGMEAENLTFDFSILDNVLKMDNIKGTAYNGSLVGKSEYNFLHTSTKSELQGVNADLKPILRVMTGKNDETTGLIDYKVKINTIGTKQAQQQRTAKGYIEFNAKKGVMGPLCQFEHFLYAQNLISQSLLKTTVASVRKALSPKNTGVYTNAKGIIEITNGNAYFKPITVQGPNMSLYITGNVNIVHGYTDIKLYGRISEEVEKTLGDLTKPVPETIMNLSSETSLGNLFYNDYNTNAPVSIVNAIPSLEPAAGMSSKIFEVIISGNPESVKSVKSFKWIVGTTNAPIPDNEYVENQLSKNKENKDITNLRKENKIQYNQSVDENKEENQPLQNIDLEKNRNYSNNNNELPDFMNSLPDNFN